LTALTALFDWLLSPLAGLDPALALAIVALVTGVLMLVAFRWTSNQEGIRRARGKVVANLLAIRIFGDAPGVTVRSLVGVLRANVGYLRHMLVPLLVMLLPMVLLLVQLDLRFSRLPLAPGVAAVVGVEFRDRGGSPPGITLEAPEGIAVETPGVRIPALGEVNWRIRAAREGVHELRFAVGATSVTKRVVVAADRRLRTVAPARSGGGILEAVLAPAEPLIPRDAGVVAITVDYLPRPFAVLGFRVHWLVAFFILSILFAFALKRPLGVEV
jgi:hypothetical protein